MEELTARNFDDFKHWTESRPALAVDVETTGLDLYHGDRIFCLGLSDAHDAWYIDFRDFSEDTFIEHFRKLAHDPARLWINHNIKFDLHAFYTSYNLCFEGSFYDTLVGARLVYNDHFSYSLDACLQRLGLPNVVKENAVMDYITKNNLWEWQTIPGKKVGRKRLFFEKVPKSILKTYVCKDVLGAYALYEDQIQQISNIDSLIDEAPKLKSVAEDESKITKSVFIMELLGVKIDEKYCEKALTHYHEVLKENENKFAAETGKDYKASPKLFEEVFLKERDKWQFTEKGNPSFESEVLQRFSHPAAKCILEIRNAKSRTDFFGTFLFKADEESMVHPNFNSGGTASGRFSSSDPNFQNLTNDEENQEEAFPVRKAIIPPSPNYCIVSMDYKQQEYCLMLDYAGEAELIEEVKNGKDVHQATADLMGVSRKYAKTLNFMLLYGGGAKKLAEALGISEAEAKKLKALYFAKLPKVQKFIERVVNVAGLRGYVYNWAGRRFFCESSDVAYRFPNRVIQGGGADIMKKAIIECSAILRGKKSYICLTIHDELNFYIHEDEISLIPVLKEAMEKVYPARFLPLKVDISHSWENLGSLKEGSPDPQGKYKAHSSMLSSNSFSGILKEPYHTAKSKTSAPVELTRKQKILKAYGVNYRNPEKYEELIPVYGKLYALTGKGVRELIANTDTGVLQYNCKQLQLEYPIERRE